MAERINITAEKDTASVLTKNINVNQAIIEAKSLEGSIDE